MKTPVQGALTSVFSSLVPGLTGGLFAIIYCISFAALIYSGELEPYLSLGIGVTLMSAVVISLVTSALSSFPPVVASPQKTTVAVIAATMAASLSVGRDPRQEFLTVTEVLMISTLLCGLGLWLLGHFRLGRLIRYIPYPVIGGFMAGSGWLTLVGAIRLMADVDVLQLSQVPQLFTPTALLNTVPGLVVGVILLVVLPRFKQVWVLPALLLGFGMLFGVGIVASGHDLAWAQGQGLVLGPFPPGGLFSWVVPEVIQQARWQSLFQQTGSLISIVLITVMSLLLNASGIELATERELDFDQELRAAGIANLVATLGGGLSGFQSLSQSILSARLGAHSRLVGGLVSLCCLVVMLQGSNVLGYIPKGIVGGILLYLGLELLVDWLYRGWFRLSRWDYGVVVVIVVMIATVGFLSGVVVGILMATVLFVVNYSQINVIKRVLNGAIFPSNVARTPEEESFLRTVGEQIQILELQGMIFFGLAVKLLNEVRERIQHDPAQQTPIRFLILDFGLCTGLDASAILTFTRLQRLLQRHSIQLILTGLKRTERRQLQSGGILGSPGCYLFPDLDRGVEWCEEQLLATRDPHTEVNVPLAAHLSSHFSPSQWSVLLSYLQPMDFPANTVLFRQGDPAQGLYLIESGRVVIRQELVNGKTLRLRSLTAGYPVGEISLFYASPRLATALTDQASHLLFSFYCKLSAPPPRAPPHFGIPKCLYPQDHGSAVISTEIPKCRIEKQFPFNAGNYRVNYDTLFSTHSILNSCIRSIEVFTC